MHLFSNPWLWGAIALSLLLQVAVVNLDFLKLAFGTLPLAFDQWLLCAAIASVLLWCGELRKLASRVFGRGKGGCASCPFDSFGSHERALRQR